MLHPRETSGRSLASPRTSEELACQRVKEKQRWSRSAWLRENSQWWRGGAQKLNLGDGKLALGQPNHQPILLTEEKNLLELVNMRRKIPAEDAEDENIVHINKTER